MTTSWLKIFIHIIIGLLLVIVIWGFNVFLNSVHIPIQHILALSGVYFIFYFILAQLFVFTWTQTFAIKILLLSMYLLLTYQLVNIVDRIVYDWLPAIDVILYDESVTPIKKAFQLRIWRAYITVNVLAILYVVVFKLFKYKLVNRKLNNDLEYFRARAIDMTYTSHFVRNIFLSKFGRMLLNDIPVDNTTKMDIIEFLVYIISMEEWKKEEEWEEALDSLNRFIRLLKVYYGERAVQFEYVEEGCWMPTKLPRGVLLFSLENCLKHGYIAPNAPVYLKVEILEEEIRQVCSNTIHLNTGDRLSGNGFQLLQKIIHYSHYNLQWSSALGNKIYTLTMLLTLNHHGKTKVLDSNAR